MTRSPITEGLQRRWNLDGQRYGVCGELAYDESELNPTTEKENNGAEHNEPDPIHKGLGMAINSFPLA